MSYRIRKTTWEKILLFNTTLRALAPFLVFYNPILAEVATASLDAPDGYMSNKAGWSWRRYHLLDKVFDLWWYIFIFIYSFRLQIFPVILALFVFRLIGQVVSLAKMKEQVLLFFPNILESYFVAYLVTLVSPGFSVFFYNNQIIVLAVSLLFSLSQEYRIHIQRLYFITLFWKLKVKWDKRRK